VKADSCGLIYDRGIWFNEGYLSTEEVKRKLYYNIQFRPLYIEQTDIQKKKNKTKQNKTKIALLL